MRGKVAFSIEFCFTLDFLKLKPETKFLCVPTLAKKRGVESDFKNEENVTQNIAYEIQPVFLPLYLSMGCYQLYSCNQNHFL